MFDPVWVLVRLFVKLCSVLSWLIWFLDWCINELLKTIWNIGVFIYTSTLFLPYWFRLRHRLRYEAYIESLAIGVFSCRSWFFSCFSGSASGSCRISHCYEVFRWASQVDGGGWSFLALRWSSSHNRFFWDRSPWASWAAIDVHVGFLCADRWSRSLDEHNLPPLNSLFRCNQPSVIGRFFSMLWRLSPEDGLPGSGSVPSEQSRRPWLAPGGQPQNSRGSSIRFFRWRAARCRRFRSCVPLPQVWSLCSWAGGLTAQRTEEQRLSARVLRREPSCAAARAGLEGRKPSASPGFLGSLTWPCCSVESTLTVAAEIPWSYWAVYLNSPSQLLKSRWSIEAWWSVQLQRFSSEVLMVWGPETEPVCTAGAAFCITESVLDQSCPQWRSLWPTTLSPVSGSWTSLKHGMVVLPCLDLWSACPLNCLQDRASCPSWDLHEIQLMHLGLIQQSRPVSTVRPKSPGRSAVMLFFHFIAFMIIWAF